MASSTPPPLSENKYHTDIRCWKKNLRIRRSFCDKLEFCLGHSCSEDVLAGPAAQLVCFMKIAGTGGGDESLVAIDMEFDWVAGHGIADDADDSSAVETFLDLHRD